MRLRITTGERTTPKPSGPVTGQYLTFELYSPGGPPGTTERTGLRLDGVSAVSLHCGGRDEPITAILTIKGVDIDSDLPTAPEALAAMALLKER